MASLPVLWHLEISHFNEKARWALDFKGVPHLRKPVFPGLQEFRARRVARSRTTPVLEIDGQGFGDSTRIIEEIERRWPDPPLYPADPEERRRALEIEDYFDEDVAHDLRRVMFNDLLTERDAFLTALYGRDHPRFKLLQRLSPVLSPGVRANFKIRPDVVAQSRPKILGALDRIEAEAGPEGFLVGDRFSVADLTAASIMAPLVVPPQFPYIKLPAAERPPASREYYDSLKDHPGFKWVLATYERHRSPSAEVPAAA